MHGKQHKSDSLSLKVRTIKPVSKSTVQIYSANTSWKSIMERKRDVKFVDMIARPAGNLQPIYIYI